MIIGGPGPLIIYGQVFEAQMRVRRPFNFKFAPHVHVFEQG
jgi:hypothetical protein